MQQHHDLISELAIGYDIACPLGMQSILDDEEPTKQAPDLQRLILAACQIYDDMKGNT